MFAVPSAKDSLLFLSFIDRALSRCGNVYLRFFVAFREAVFSLTTMNNLALLFPVSSVSFFRAAHTVSKSLSSSKRVRFAENHKHDRKR